MNEKELNELKAKIIELMDDAYNQVQSFYLNGLAPIQIYAALETLNQLLELTDKYLEETGEALE